jgi:hypothetical protein
VLFGDSHAAQWLEGMDQVAKARGWRLVVLTKAECPAAYVRGQISSQLKRPYRECNAWRTRTMNEIIALRPVLTVLGSSQLYVSPDRLSRWRASMRATSQRLSDAGLNHVVLLDTPNPAWDIPGCLSAADFAPLARNNCDFPRAEAIHSDVLRATRQAVSAIPHARVVDMNDLICPTAVCPARTNNLVVYRDFSHLSDEFVLSLVPELSARMAPTG